MVVKKCVCFSVRLMLHSTSPVQRPLIKSPQLPCKLCIYIQHNYGILDPKQLCELINEWCYYEGIFSPTFYCLLKYFVHLLPLFQIKFAGGSNLCREAQTSLVLGGICQVSFRDSLSSLSWVLPGASFQWDVLRKPPQRGVQEVSDTEPSSGSYWCGGIKSSAPFRLVLIPVHSQDKNHTAPPESDRSLRTPENMSVGGQRSVRIL